MDFSITLPVSFGVAHWTHIEGLRAGWGLKSTDDGVILPEEKVKVRTVLYIKNNSEWVSE